MAAERRLRWDLKLTVGHEIGDGGRQLTKATYKYADYWASGCLLPAEGRFSWSVRVERSQANSGAMVIGVCDELNRRAWGLNLMCGSLLVWNRDPTGRVSPGTSANPDGLLDGAAKWPVLVNPDAQQTALDCRAEGTVVEFIFDTLDGSLAARLDSGPLLRALSGIPRGTQLRPWARLFNGKGDSVSFAQAYV